MALLHGFRFRFLIASKGWRTLKNLKNEWECRNLTGEFPMTKGRCQNAQTWRMGRFRSGSHGAKTGGSPVVQCMRLLSTTQLNDVDQSTGLQLEEYYSMHNNGVALCGTYKIQLGQALSPVSFDLETVRLLTSSVHEELWPTPTCPLFLYFTLVYHSHILLDDLITCSIFFEHHLPLCFIYNWSLYIARLLFTCLRWCPRPYLRLPTGKSWRNSRKNQ